MKKIKKRKFKKQVIAFLAAAMMAGTTVYPMQGTVLVHAEGIYTHYAGIDFTYTLSTTGEGNEQYATIQSAKTYGKTIITVPDRVGQNGEYPVRYITSLASTDQTEREKQKTTIEEIELPGTIEQIYGSAFSGWTGLKEVRFRENKEKTNLSIGWHAFYGCSHLETFDMSKKAIGKFTASEGAFCNCERLKIDKFACEVEMQRNSFAGCVSMGDVVFEGKTYLAATALTGSFQKEGDKEKKLTFKEDVTMGSTMSSSGGSSAALAQCKGLTEVEFEKEVTLCEGAFGGDESLKKIKWGTGVNLPVGTYVGASLSFLGGCDSLETFEFQEGYINFGNYAGTIPKLKYIIYNKDISMNYWLEAQNVIFKGNVTATEELTATTTKNVYFYNPDAKIENIVMDGVTIYGIKGSGDKKSKVQEYAQSDKVKNCPFVNIIDSIKVTETVDQTEKTTYDQEYILQDGPVESIKPEDIHLSAKAVLLGLGEEIELSENEDEIHGYRFEHGELAASAEGVKNPFRLYFSGLEKKIDVALKYSSLSYIEAELNPDIKTVVEGKNQVTKDMIKVTAHYNDGKTERIKDVTDKTECVIDEHTIKIGANEVKVSYTDPYTNVKRECVVVYSDTKSSNIVGTKKEIVPGLKITYNGPTEVVVGTKINENALVVKQVYTNGEEEELKEFHVKDGSLIKNCGSNDIIICTNDGKNEGKITVTGIAVGTLMAVYSGKELVVGDKINIDDIDIKAYKEDGTLLEVDKNDVTLSNEYVESTMNNIIVSYGNKSVIVTIPAYKKEIKEIKVYLHPDIEVVKVNSTLDIKSFIVEEYYNNGESEVVSEPKLEILQPYNIVEGLNTITVVYNGKNYQIQIQGVDEVPVKEIRAKYVGATSLNQGDEIKLSDIEVIIYYKDGTSVKAKEEEYGFSDTTNQNIYIKKYDQTVKIQGIGGGEDFSTSTPVVIPTPVVSTDNPTSTPPVPVSEAPVESSTPIPVSEAPVESSTPTPVSEAPVESSTPVPVSEAPVLTSTPGVSSSPDTSNIPDPTTVPTPDVDGAVFVMNCNAKTIKLAAADVKVTKTYAKKTIIFTFRLQNASGLKYQIVQKGKKIKKEAWKTVKDNALTIKKETKLSQVYFTYKDKNGKDIIQKTTYFTLDTSNPTTNIKNNGTYKKVKVTFKDSISGVKKAVLNGKKVKSGVTVKKKGSYKLVITDKAGNKTVKKFKIKK